jgi:hypothetical protein
MSDKSPPRRLSQIFDPLTSLSELQQHLLATNQPFNYATASNPLIPQPFNYNTASSTSTSLSSASNQSTKLSSSSSGSYANAPVASGRVLLGTRSTPNSPRLLSRRARPPLIPQKPNASFIANPSLVALDTGAPWPTFSSLTESLDVHQVNNYQQDLPEVSLKKKAR